MRFFWRSDATCLTSHETWIDHLDGKNRVAGTSAPTLATAWAGPLDLLAALATQPSLERITISSATVEPKTSFDAYGGNVRNHDLVLRAATADGEPVVVCVEAKAGEPLGAPVAKQAVAAAKAHEGNPRSRGSARLADLVARLCRYPIDDSRVGELSYQLLTAWAGTLVDAQDAAHAVFALHEFRTDERPVDKSSLNRDELVCFADVVLGVEAAIPTVAPWCVRVPDVPGVGAALYVAHAVSDLRGAALARRAD